MKLIILLLFTTILFSQESIVAAGNQSETIGEVFPIMQQVDTIIQVSLETPTFELPEPPKPKPAAKKKSFFEKLIEAILKLFKK